MQDKITFALAKGRLAEKSVDILEKCGIDCRSILEPSRRLVMSDASGKFEFIFVKPSDVPIYVEHGVADVGVVGKDTLMEENRDVYELIDLGFAKCRLCLAGYENFDLSKPRNILKVATKYVNVAKDYFDGRGQNVEIIPLHGSIELGPIVGLSDIILDIVESGKTLQENNLAILEEIVNCSARFIVNKVSMKTKADVIKPLVKKISDIINNKEN